MVVISYIQGDNMALYEKQNPDYIKWMKENNFTESMTYSPSELIFKNDGTNAWVDERGKGYQALSNQKIWEAGSEYGYKKAMEEINKKS